MVLSTLPPFAISCLGSWKYHILVVHWATESVCKRIGGCGFLCVFLILRRNNDGEWDAGTGLAHDGGRDDDNNSRLVLKVRVLCVRPSWKWGIHISYTMLGKENALLVWIRKGGIFLERLDVNVFAFPNFADMRFYTWMLLHWTLYLESSIASHVFLKTSRSRRRSVLFQLRKRVGLALEREKGVCLRTRPC